MSPCSSRNVPYRVRIAGNQGRRHQVRIAVDVDLLRRVAHLGRVVHDQGRRMDMLEKVGRRDVGHVEGRVLAQQDRVHFRQVGEPRFAQIGMAALLGPHGQALHWRAQHALAEAQRVRRVVMQRMAARLRLHGQHESAVRPDVDGVDGIHLDRHAQRHVTLLPSPGSRTLFQDPAPGPCSKTRRPLAAPPPCMFQVIRSPRTCPVAREAGPAGARPRSEPPALPHRSAQIGTVSPEKIEIDRTVCLAPRSPPARHIDRNGPQSLP